MVLEQLLTFAVGTKGGPALATQLLGKFDAVPDVLAASDEESMGFDGMTPEAVGTLDPLTKEIGEGRVTLLLGA